MDLGHATFLDKTINKYMYDHCMYIYIYTNINTYISMYTYTYTYTYTYIYTYVYMYTYILPADSLLTLDDFRLTS